MSKSSASESVKVVVRCRPLNSKERQDGRLKIVEVRAKREDAARDMMLILALMLTRSSRRWTEKQVK